MGSVAAIEIDTAAILRRLTLDEKISLLSAKDWWRTPIISRDGIYVPHIKTTDGPNGARGESYVSGIKAACFPCATSLGASFDTAIAFRTGLEVAKEAATKSANILLAPTLNVIRSPLGGRNYETYSEDPILLGTLAAAYVNGCQSHGIAATPKHYVANDAENQRKTLSVKVDEQTLRELYLYPFQILLKNSQPLCFMTSYNKVNGTYVSEDRYLIEEVLRKEFGFSGLVLSDWMGTYSTVEAINAGLDLEMPGPTKWRGEKLLRAIGDKQVSEDTINKSAQRVLDLIKALGRFEEPRGELAERAAENPERDDFIRDAAAEGMVLLKNHKDILPLPKRTSLAVIGHHANIVSLGGGGSARVNALHAITPLQGLNDIGLSYTYSPGVPVFGALPHADPSIVSETRSARLGSNSERVESRTPVRLEWFNGLEIGKCLVHEEMISDAEYMIKEAWPAYLSSDYCTRLTFDVTPKTSGSHVLSVISTGPAKCYIDDNEVFDRPQEKNLVLESFYFFKSKLERRFTFVMQAGRRYTLCLEAWRCDPDILQSAPLFGKMFQGAALRFFEHVDTDQAIASAVENAKTSEYALVCVGTTSEIESEGYDRDTMDLPGAQCELVRAVAGVNSKTIVVNFSGSPVTMDFVDEVPTIVQAWFPGQECGHSLARVLTGLINPCGHLPFSWPKKLEDNPSFENFPAENNLIHYAEELDVGYRFYARESSPVPLFPFGFGLSYTTFEICDVATSGTPKNSRSPKWTIEVSCRVKNTGTRPGKVAAQFYVEMPPTTIGHARPPRELKAFKKVELESGQESTLTVTLDKYAVSVYDAANARWQCLVGEFRVFVGKSVDDLRTSAKFVVREGFTWTGI